MTRSRSAFQASGKRFRTQGISRRASQITISAIKEMPILGARVGGCVSLGQGIPSFPTPRHIVDSVCDFLRSEPDAGKYSLGPGSAPLRRAVAEDLGARWGLAVDPEREICITVGAMEGLLAGILTVVDRGDEVILPSPNYASHIEQVLLAEGVPVFVPLTPDDWRLDLDGVKRAITPRTKAIVVCSPHNPTGTVFSEAELRGLAELAVANDLFLIADEAYEFLLYDGLEHFSLTSVPELKDQLIAAFSFSKKYAMTGWRVGYVYASEGVLDHLQKIHDAATICAPTVSQAAALAALEGPQDCVGEIRNTLQDRRDLTCDRLRELAGDFRFVKPKGSYYLMAEALLPGLDSMTLALRLLNEAKVITIPGVAFGPTGENHIRISFGGTEEDINEAFDRIGSWLQANKP
jgi:aminotransferase